MRTLNTLVSSWKKSAKAGTLTGDGFLFHFKDAYLVNHVRDKAQLEGIFQGGKIFKNSKTAYACVKDIEGVPFFFKQMHHRSRPLYHSFRYCVCPSRGYINAVISQKLINAGVPTPRIYACGEYREFFLLHTSYLVAEAVDGNSLSSEIPHLCRDSLSIKIFLAYWGSLIKRMHDAGVYHSDTKSTNFYLLNGRELPEALPVIGEKWDGIGVWDLDGANFFEDGVPEKFRVADVSRAVASFLMDASRCDEIRDEIGQRGTAWIVDWFSLYAGVDGKMVAEEVKKRWSKKLKLLASGKLSRKDLNI